MMQGRYATSCTRTDPPILRAITLTVCILLWGCGAPITIPSLTVDEVPRMEATGNYPHLNYRLEPGDTVRISFTFHPEMAQEDIIRPDGKITATLVGEIIVSGMTVAELEKLLAERTSNRLRDPEVKISITRFAEKDVYIAGEVGKPGTIPYRKGLTPLQAVAAAGGFLETARIDSVILVRTGGAGDDVVSRKINLAEVVTDGAKESLHLAPHDILFVPKTPIANANLWVRQYLTDLVPFNSKAVPTVRP